MLAYKDRRITTRLVIPRLENADKTPKLNPRINIELSSAIGKEVYPEFIRPGISGLFTYRLSHHREGDEYPACAMEEHGILCVQCESKKIPRGFLAFFPKDWEFLVQILQAYYTFLSTLDYKFLFNYLQL